MKNTRFRNKLLPNLGDVAFGQKSSEWFKSGKVKKCYNTLSKFEGKNETWKSKSSPCTHLTIHWFQSKKEIQFIPYMYTYICKMQLDIPFILSNIKLAEELSKFQIHHIRIALSTFFLLADRFKKIVLLFYKFDLALIHIFKLFNTHFKLRKSRFLLSMTMLYLANLLVYACVYTNLII